MKRLLIFLVIAGTLNACATPGSQLQSAQQDLESARTLAGWIAPSCDAQSVAQTAGGALDPARVRVLNWNTQKASAPAQLEVLARLQSDADLVMLQEAVLSRSFLDALGHTNKHHSFAPGYEGFGKTTGVLTTSNVQPLSRCSLRFTEPWLRTDKAASVTRYALSNMSQTLLVVNIHMINFTLRLEDMVGQLAATLEIIAAHDGPVIMSGDFNTWREGRSSLVEESLRAVGLAPVAFAVDRRTRIFGQPLDHIYLRGMKPLASSTREVGTSDHNPMLVTLTMDCTACATEQS